MSDATQQAIIRAAREQGIDPSFALAVADRESRFDTTAKASKTIRGAFQMRGDLRGKYGVGDSDDAYTQAKGWGGFIGDVKKEMAGAMGRDPTDPELYAGHHFGGVRAGRMFKMDPSTPVDQVFTPGEMAVNPHFAKAGTVGNLLGSVTSDIAKRQAKFGGAGSDVQTADYSAFGVPVDGVEPAKSGTSSVSSTPDFSSFGQPVEQPTQSAQQPPSAPDYSQFGVPA